MIFVASNLSMFFYISKQYRNSSTIIVTKAGLPPPSILWNVSIVLLFAIDNSLCLNQLCSINIHALRAHTSLPFCQTITESMSLSLSLSFGRAVHMPFFRRFSHLVDDGRTLSDFILNSSNTVTKTNTLKATKQIDPENANGEYPDENIPRKTRRAYYIESYGCQMNVSDTELVHAILQKHGMHEVQEMRQADVMLVNTCAIRDGAEQKVMRRLETFRSIKAPHRRKTKRPDDPLIAVLGCMAERLKTKLLDDNKLVDIVVGPDAYRDLPRLIDAADDGEQVNVQLSLEETYADITPVRSDGTTAFVSIMRGCDNMCSYCIVPFTRGRERSRDTETILREVRELSDAGCREVTLLGQNVNSYNYIADEVRKLKPTKEAMTPGFVNISRRPELGISFAELLDRVAAIDPEMRIRFTSPHPKDFSLELIEVIKRHHNICKHIHLPVQSGSNAVLERMRRGYTREAYLELIDRFRQAIPGVTFCTDMISGFCGETEDDHAASLSMLEHVQYSQAFLFAYSEREKTHAHRTMVDDVPADVKKRRVAETIATYHRVARDRAASEIGTLQLCLLDHAGKKGGLNFSGKSEHNKRCFIPRIALPVVSSGCASFGDVRLPHLGEYVVLRVLSSTPLSITGSPVAIISLRDFHCASLPLLCSVPSSSSDQCSSFVAS